jgi:hypothetical protein
MVYQQVFCPRCGVESEPIAVVDLRGEAVANRSFALMGLLAGTITALLFLKINLFAFPFLGLTCGLATRNFWRCLTGVFTSAGFGIIVSVLFVVLAKRHPMSTGPLSASAYDYSNFLLGALIGSAIQAPQRRLVPVALSCGILSQINFGIVIFAIRGYFPQLRGAWDYLVIAISIPAFGLGMWWPVDFVNKRLWKMNHN